MPLSAGARLGPYEILAPLGAGGMGEVYRARDTRLGRMVAIKISKEQFSERFEVEARAIAQLSHPNICTLHDVGPNYLVMEYVEGTPLRGPLPIDKAIGYAKQILNALDAAHRKGITHRDLKPDNILVTKQGVKLLDFGLAKHVTTLEESDATRALTQQGQLLGTLHYMSPEQLQGKEADARSDIFSFGLVLYEMLTGKRAFEGSAPASVIAAILEREPASADQIGGVPALNRLIRLCLAKDREERRQTVRDVLLDLEWIAEEQAAPAKAVESKRHAGVWIAAVVAMCAIAAWAAWRFAPRSTPSTQVMRASISAGASEWFGGSWWWNRNIAISPDGSQLAYVATHDGVSRVYLRPLTEDAGHPLAGSEGADNPFFSPDGRWLGMSLGRRLQKIPLGGGPPVTIAVISPGPGGRVYGARWMPDDMIYFGLGAFGGLTKVPAGGGTPELVTKLDPKREEADHRFPEMLPGGRAFLLALRSGRQPSFDDADIAAISLASGERKILIHSGTDPHYLSTGHLVFLRAGVLLAAPFDATKLEVKGPAVPVAENVIENPRIGAGQFAISSGGTLVYIPGGVSFGEHELVLIDRTTGATRLLTAKKRAYEDFTLSPDGRLIATTVEGPTTDTWIHDIASDSETRFTSGVENRDPTWTRDGKRLVYVSQKGGVWGLFSRPIDGREPEQRFTETDVMGWFSSPDGHTLLCETYSPTKLGLCTIAMEGDHTPRPLLNTQFNEDWATFSPDGRWIAYDSDESGRSEVYVTSFPEPGTRVRVSSEGGLHPLWAPNGRELYYRTGANIEAFEQRAFAQRVQVIAVPIETSPMFKVTGNAHMLFEGPFFASDHDWAITPDGKGFIFMRDTQQTGPREIKMVLNWFEEVKRRASTP